MTVEERIARCVLLEKMHYESQYCMEIGLVNISTYNGECIDAEEADTAAGTS